MRPSVVFEKHRDEIRRIVLAHKGANPRVFGSVATGTDDEESDLDLLIDPVEGMSLFNLGGMSYRLEELLGIKVDITLARNVYPRYRDRIFSEAKPV